MLIVVAVSSYVVFDVIWCHSFIEQFRLC